MIQSRLPSETEGATKACTLQQSTWLWHEGGAYRSFH
jgi:hypothetical protein